MEPTELPPQTEAITAAGHEFLVFVEVSPLVRAMLADIRQAQRRVWLEVYILGDDEAGRSVVEALADRAAAGLDVRVMIDAVGSFDLAEGLLSELQHAGAKVHVYNSWSAAREPGSFWQRFNRRNHRKLLVIDEQVAYFGGMNIVQATEGERSAEWRDVHVRMLGPEASEAAAAMERLWRQCHGQVDRWPKWPLAEMLQRSGEGVYFFDSLPRLRFRRADRVFKLLMRSAQRSITLSMAYFIPLPKVLRELKRARQRGVIVRVIVPEVSDVPVVQWAMRHFYRQLLELGVRLYERRDRMLHGKVMLIDDVWTVVGSCNLDPRSLRLNLELTGVVRSPGFARTLARVVSRELRQSRRVTIEQLPREGTWARLRDRLAWQFRRWL